MKKKEIFSKSSNICHSLTSKHQSKWLLYLKSAWKTLHCWTGILVQQGFGSNILNFDQLPFLSPLRYKKVTHLFRKPKAIAIECQPEIGWILTLMYPYLYVTKRGVLLGLEGLYRVKGTLGLKFILFQVGIQLELLWAF